MLLLLLVLLWLVLFELLALLVGEADPVDELESLPELNKDGLVELCGKDSAGDRSTILDELDSGDAVWPRFIFRYLVLMFMMLLDMLDGWYMCCS